jgi:class 3 adenylate cyclase
MAEDQIDAIRSLKACRDRITVAFLKFNGRVIDFVGDNMLGEFSNARSAADCAVEIHRALAGIKRTSPFIAGFSCASASIWGT